MTDITQVNPVALADYARKYSILVNSGVSLMRSMAILAATTDDEALRDINNRIMADVEAGDTLSAAMSRWPETFRPRYVALIRAGEIGGVLDETMALLADLLDRDIELRRQCHLHVVVAASSGVATAAEIEERVVKALAAGEGETAAALFCEVFGTMLESGVPLRLALETAAAMYPAEQAAILHSAAQALDESQPCVPQLARTGCLPPAAVQLLTIGEETGALALLAHNSAEFLRCEVEAKVAAALGEI